MNLVFPTNSLESYFDEERPNIFLAGSIEMGKAIDWQAKVASMLDNYDVNIFNPRRDDWDWNSEQSIDNPQFFKQVNWEQNAISISDIVIMNFLPDTKSPITLLELGHILGSNLWFQNLFVCCPKEFWRKGNVDIMCHRYKVPVYTDLEYMINREVLPYLSVVSNNL